MSDPGRVSKSRVSKLRSVLAEQQLDGFLTFDPVNQRWLTGWQQVFDEESAHAALITATDAYIHTDPRYSGAMRDQIASGWQISDDPVRHSVYIAELLASGLLVQAKASIRLGIEDGLPLGRYRALQNQLTAAEIANQVELVETTAQILQLRAIKDEGEIELLRKAQSITDLAFSELINWIEPGQSELAVANYLEFSMRNLGADGLAFASIVASGPNSAKPHAVPTERQLELGDFVVLDFGARYLGYCADMTRTICIGQPSGQQLDIYNAVLEAHNQAKAAITAGLAAAEAHNLAADILAKRGYEKEFIHSLGHGVGIQVHELPVLHPKSDAILQSGNVVTVEPGVYLPGLGGVRIEDFGLVTTEGFDSFTLSSRELVAV